MRLTASQSPPKARSTCCWSIRATAASSARFRRRRRHRTWSWSTRRRSAPTSPISARARPRSSTWPPGTKLADIATGRGSEALALAPGGRELWVAARADDTIAIVATATREVLARLPVSGVPIRIAFTPDGRTALVTCAGSGELAVIDVGSRTERSRHRIDVPLAPDAAARPFAGLAPGSVLPVGLWVAADGRSAYVAATMGDRVVQFDLASFKVAARDRRGRRAGRPRQHVRTAPGDLPRLCQRRPRLSRDRRRISLCTAISSAVKYIYD